ncbi:MAG: hypothetical protein ACQKBW_04490 [Puniceicoccales bacterium]
MPNRNRLYVVDVQVRKYDSENEIPDHLDAGDAIRQQTDIVMRRIRIGSYILGGVAAIGFGILCLMTQGQ